MVTLLAPPAPPSLNPQFPLSKASLLAKQLFDLHPPLSRDITITHDIAGSSSNRPYTVLLARVGVTLECHAIHDIVIGIQTQVKQTSSLVRRRINDSVAGSERSIAVGQATTLGTDDGVESDVITLLQVFHDIRATGQASLDDEMSITEQPYTCQSIDMSKYVNK